MILFSMMFLKLKDIFNIVEHVYICTKAKGYLTFLLLFPFFSSNCIMICIVNYFCCL